MDAKFPMEFKNNIIHRPDSSEYNDEPSLGHLIIKSLSNAADKTMIIHGITGEKLSASTLLTKSIEIAKALLLVGINRGDVVSIVSENSFEFAYITFGTIFLNCPIAPLNSAYGERELVHAFNLSKPKFIFASDLTILKVSNVIKSLDFVKKVILIDDGPSKAGVVHLKNLTNSKLLDEINFQSEPVDKLKTICLIICSSGTTGLPKGVQISQANMIANIRQFMWETTTNVDYELVMLGLLPMYHIYGCEVLIGTIANITGTIILLQKFEEKTFLGCIQKYRCTTLFLVPPVLVFLAKNKNVANYDLTSIRMIYSGAAPLSKELEQAVMDRLKNPKMLIKQSYGMSELTSGALLQKNIAKPGSVGDINLGVSAKVIDDNGNTLGPNQRGQLCFKGSRVMIGYIGNEEATNEIIDNDGWLHTGDVGYYDEDLQFYIVDRIKELIKYKAFQVAPAEIEALLLTHPKIQDCGVIGKPDELVGELPMAFVVRSDQSLSESEVVDYVNKNASLAKLRGGVIFVDEIPKNQSGKILRRELRKWINSDKLTSKL